MSIARRVLIGLSAAAAIGLLIFGIMVYRSVTIERIEPADVHARFAAARALLPPGPSLVTLDDAGDCLQRTEQRALRSFQDDHVFLLELGRCSRRAGRLWRTLFSPVFAGV